MPDAASGPGYEDPTGLGDAVARLSSSSRRSGQGAFFVLVRALEAGERVEVVVRCRFSGAEGAMALTNRRLVVVNAREWNPDVLSVALDPGLTVQGWQDGRSAALVFSNAGGELVVDQIVDRDLAQQLAAGVRARVG